MRLSTSLLLRKGFARACDTPTADASNVKISAWRLPAAWPMVGRVKVLGVPKEGWRCLFERLFESGRRDSNPLPQPWEVWALPEGIHSINLEFNSSGFVTDTLLISSS